MADRATGERERLGALRLRPFADLPSADTVPCNETSDAARLCRDPLVTVRMLAYNHGDSIRASIEGVMMQETDFPFELVIGEDASPDGTRQVCLEMQKRYPERIRVLWSERNVGGSGNWVRLESRSRGSLLAQCEGDDIWTDPHKLQKQVEIMRRHPEVGLCLGGTDVEHVDEGGRLEPFPYSGGGIRIVPGAQLVLAYLDDVAVGGIDFTASHFQTSGYLIRKSALDEAKRRFPEVYRWDWRFGDISAATTVASVSDVAFLLEPVSRYRMTGRGVSSTMGVRLLLEGVVYAVYLRARTSGLEIGDAVAFEARRLRRNVGRLLSAADPSEQKSFVAKSATNADLLRLFDRIGYRRALKLLAKGELTPAKWKGIRRIGRIMEVFCR